MGYQSEAELKERLMAKLELQGYERINIENYEALVENFRKQLNVFKKETLNHELTDNEFKRVMNIVDSKNIYASPETKEILKETQVLHLDRDTESLFDRKFNKKGQADNA